ncbi:PepSY-like domain-containing protein [Chitinophaga deserti]|uniref:PepSY-like domain-containing protein n=1 Tax=Chitinophaga deserti TaxID=2164099 RepID=UPI000D6B825A|nr:PepSY-like domain-containing protein [Chitinophaga deserti]
MKKIIAILTLVTVFVTGAFAADGVTIDNKKVLEAFKREFATAEDVAWYTTPDKFVAKFTMHARKVTAHYNKEGELLATSRYITDSDLPLNVITRLMKKYPDQKINNIVEYEADGSTTYVITLESETHWTVLRAESNGNISRLKKLQKA